MKPFIVAAILGAVIMPFVTKEEVWFLYGAFLGPVVMLVIYFAAFAFGVGRTHAKYRHHYRDDSRD